MEKANVLVIGAGPAGLAAAEAAAAGGAAVTLAGDEAYAPYWRPRLTKCLSEPVPADKLQIKKPEWYAQTGIRLALNKTAERIDAERRQVIFTGGDALGYDALILAAGARPFTPCVPGVQNPMTLRSYDDAMRIREIALAAGRVVIVGGGLLGLETAWELNAAGVSTTLVERGPWLMPRQLDQTGGEHLKRRLEAAGLTLFTGTDPAEKQALYADAPVILCAGVQSNLSLAQSAGVATGRSIVVDDHMSTNVAGIFACGDIAEYRGRCWGLMPVAQEQGKVAGANAAGGDLAYVETPPSPMLKVGAVSVFSVGDISECDGATMLRRETETEYQCLMLKDGTLVGAVLIGNTAQWLKLKKAVAERKSFPEGTPLETMLATV